MRAKSTVTALAIVFTAWAVLAFGCFTGSANAAAPVVLKIQTAVPAASVYFELMKRFGERIEKMSAGRIKTEMLPEGAVVAPFESLDAVGKGVVDGGFCWTHWWSGKAPGALLFSAPLAGATVGLDQLSHMAWYYEGGGQKLHQELFDDVLKANVVGFLLMPMGPDPLGWFKTPITSVADLKKMKYRAPPGIASEPYKEMGVPTISMGAGDMLPAAQKGVIDAGEWIGPAEDMNLGFHTVWKHYYLQGLHQTTDVGEFILNKDVWNKLTPDLQEIFKIAAMATVTDTWNFDVYRNAKALEILKKQHGVTVHDTPQDYYPAFIKATQTVLEKYSAKDPFFKKVWDSQKEFAKIVVPYWNKVLQVYVNQGLTGAEMNGFK